MPEKQTSRETLAFSTPEHAEKFTEKVEQRTEYEEHPEINREREIVAEELAKEFSQAGEEVSLVSTPWEHSTKEHEEAKQLVQIALKKDLRAAIEQAKKQADYPRNVDLLHDLLTTELYNEIRSKGLTRESLSPWLIVIVGIITIASLLVFYILILI